MKNENGGDQTQRIRDALEINRNLFKIWTQRKHFLTFLSQLPDTIPPDNMNVRRVLELEEMKREIMNFL